MTGDIIILPHAGGLGDGLFYDTIPEEGARQGRRVFISSRVQYRNDETRQLVWDQNPFIAGYSNLDPTFHWENFRPLLVGSKQGSAIKRLERLFGFEGVNEFPKCYYKPKFLPDWHDRIAADPTSISQSFPADKFDQFTMRIMRLEGYDQSKLWVLTNKHQGQSGRDSLPWVQRYETRDIFEYADIIYSCKAFLTGDSGGNSLASAIKGYSPYPAIFTLTTTMSYSDQIFMWSNVNYCPVGGLTPDYKDW